MKLRYLHLPRCGPLENVEIAFGQESLFYGPEALPGRERKGTVNFVVGINGTGKSSLLRAIYQAFKALKAQQFPAQPMTLIWDALHVSEPVTVLMHHSGQDSRQSFVSQVQLPPRARLEDFRAAVHEEIIDEANTHAHRGVDPAESVKGGFLQSAVPRLVIAYTSGAESLWDDLEMIPYNSMNRTADEGIAEDRPRGWSLEREWEEERPVQMANLLTRFVVQQTPDMEKLPGGGGSVGQLSAELGPALIESIKPFTELSRRTTENQIQRSRRPPAACFRVDESDLRIAGVSLAVWQASRELSRIGKDATFESLRAEFHKLAAARGAGDQVRRVLGELDWFWPTHLSITYRDAEDRVSRVQHEQLFALCALADEVVRQPRGMSRAVISLGPRAGMDLRAAILAALSYGLPNQAIEDIGKRIAEVRTGAEAVLGIFSETTRNDEALSDLFSALRQWRHTGLLQDITLTVKRLGGPANSGESEPLECLVVYDQLSDGERMLLERTALFSLLHKRDGSLLLLDEPETHFNDAWKREIVDLVDDALLKTTAAQVLISTHTSIALTDIFADEVTVLRKEDGQTRACSIQGGLFGADQGEIMMNVFGAESSMGRRAQEFLDQMLSHEWQPEEADQLGKVVDRIGSSLYRAELRQKLNKLREATAPPQVLRRKPSVEEWMREEDQRDIDLSSAARPEAPKEEAEEEESGGTFFA